MLSTRLCSVFVAAAFAPYAAGAIVAVNQERFVSTQVSVSSGNSSGDFDEALNFSPFVRTLNSSTTGPNGAGADASASQDSVLSSTLVTGVLSASSSVSTGTTFITGEGDAQSNFLFFFDLAAPTEVQFNAEGALSYIGRNPDGEPSDLYGRARVELLDSNSLDLVAGFNQFSDAGTDSASFTGTLPAGSYVILATAQMHAFSADLLGPPARSGSGNAEVSFSLAVVPTPSASIFCGVACLFTSRRRRLQ